MLLEIVTPEKALFKGEIKLIKLPGANGSFEILKNHAPIVSTLDYGEIKIIQDSGEVDRFDIRGGVVECNKNHIIVLAEPA